MRTTVALPPDLLRAAKARSAERGESLKALLTRAVAAELEAQGIRSGHKTRVTLPLFGTATSPRIAPTGAALERALADADAQALPVPLSRPPRRRRRPR